jgi:hypothetical protein
MFNKKKQGGPPDRPFEHADDCKILAAEPGVEIPLVGGRQWALADSLRVRIRRMSTKGRPTVELGSTRSTRLPSATRRMRAPGHERSGSPSSDLEGQRRRGRGLLVGGVLRLRLRLAGSAIRRRGERRVTTNLLPRPPAPQTRHGIGHRPLRLGVCVPTGN